MSNPTWICLGLEHEGRLIVEALFIQPGTFAYKARMEWPPPEHSVSGGVAPTFDEAMASLERALMFDAAREMQEGGAV